MNQAALTDDFVMTERDELLGLYSDMYKDTHGIRPGLRYYSEAPLCELRAAIDRLSVELDQVIEDEKAQELRNTEICEGRIAAIIEMGADDRATAIRWLHEAEGTNGDSEFLCYCLGVPYGYFNKETK